MSKKNNPAHNAEENYTSIIEKDPAETYKSILGEDTEEEERRFTAELKAEAAAAEAKQAKEASAKKSSTKKILTIAGITAASVALVGCLTVAGVGIYNKFGVKPVVSTANTKVDTKVMTCIYKDMVNMYVSNYGAEVLLNNYGMDVSKPLKEQPYPYDETVTWFDMLMDQSIAAMEQQLVIYDAANAAGHTLTERELQQIEEQVAATDISTYGNGVTEADLRKALEIQMMSSSYYAYYMNNTTFSDEELEEYYNANALAYQTCGLGGFSINYLNEESEEGATGLPQDEAKAIADQLAAAKSPAQFEQIVADYLVEYEDYTEEQLENLLPSLFIDNFTYSAGHELAEWAFGGAKVNETYSISDSSAYYVYMLTSEPKRDETPTVNVRHILFMNGEDNKGDAEAALAEWEAGEATEDSFAELANTYSEDGGSNTNGGLYEGVYPGQMVPEFNDWCFDASRKPGDTGIVETSYGFHVMYFSEAGDPMWKSTISEMLVQENYSAWFEEQKALYPVTINDAAVNGLEG